MATEHVDRGKKDMVAANPHQEYVVVFYEGGQISTFSLCTKGCAELKRMAAQLEHLPDDAAKLSEQLDTNQRT